jgi:hypothetical protein
MRRTDSISQSLVNAADVRCSDGLSFQFKVTCLSNFYHNEAPHNGQVKSHSIACILQVNLTVHITISAEGLSETNFYSLYIRGFDTPQAHAS